jgi:hypothetical protein
MYHSCHENKPLLIVLSNLTIFQIAHFKCILLYSSSTNRWGNKPTQIGHELVNRFGV